MNIRLGGRNFAQLIGFVISLALLLPTPSRALGAPVCAQVFSSSAAPSEPSKYEKLAEELGLTYLKSPVPAGYHRVILNSRTYLNKDGIPGKTLYYYRYLRPDGSIVRPKVDGDEYRQLVARFKSFKPDPHWKNVWLSEDENTHIQILAKNAQNETVAIYHEDWGQGASRAKFRRVQEFGQHVPGIRDYLNRILADESLAATSKEKVEATALLLLMSGRIRVGDLKYFNKNGTSGVTTLQKEQVIVDKDKRLSLIYIGKSGNKDKENPTYTTIQISDPYLKQSILDLRNSNTRDPRLLVYSLQNSNSALTPNYLNRRLRELVAETNLPGSQKGLNSVKDLRTWAATVKTVQELITAGPPPQSLTAKDRVLKTVAKNVSRLLNNTPAVARQDYIDPRILNPDAYTALYSLCQNQFPQLLLASQNIPANKVTEIFDQKFDPEFENLTLTFLNQLEKTN